MEKWMQMGRKLRELVNPSTMPVAVKFLKEEDQIPVKARRPLRDLKVKMAPCQGSAMARLYGWTVAFTREDQGCAIAAHTYGWERVRDAAGAISFFTRMNYASDEKCAAEMLAGFRLLEMGYDPIVVYSPLERTKVRQPCPDDEAHPRWHPSQRQTHRKLLFRQGRIMYRGGYRGVS
ncbi:MAG: DUF169 domain-containing protein [Deltaproteobacteria bacterium]|nr:DUF169 domain-containing protein [Deltaproteobacteria bacterium]